MRLFRRLLPHTTSWIISFILFFVVASSLSLLAINTNNYVSRTSLEEKPTTCDSIIKSKNYVGPPEYLKPLDVKKYTSGTIVDLNAADSLSLIKVPGIGRTIAHRILSLRKLLGGFYTVEQLQEVYGIDNDKYLLVHRWFAIKTPPKTYKLSELKQGKIPRHRYLSYKQMRIMNKLISRYSHIYSWSELMHFEEFNHDDSVRLSHYFIEK